MIAKLLSGRGCSPKGMWVLVGASVLHSGIAIGQAALPPPGGAPATQKATPSAVAESPGTLTPEPVGSGPELPQQTSSDPPEATETETSAEASPLDECLHQHISAQQLRKAARLLESRDALLKCAAAECPEAVRRDCVGWNEEITERIPSLSFRVTIGGEYHSNVKVYIGDRLILDGLNGRAIEVDPGVHELRFEAVGHPPQKRQVLVSEGEQLRAISVDFPVPFASGQTLAGEAPTRPPPEQTVPKTHSIGTWTYVLGGAGVVSAVAAGTLGLSTLTLESEMEAGCSPRCGKKTVDVLKQRAMLTDVATGVSALLLTGAVLLYFQEDGDDSPRGTEVELSILPGQGVMGWVSIWGM